MAAAGLSAAGCAVAGKRAAAGVQESVLQAQESAGEEGASPSEVAGSRAVQGAVAELSSPQSTKEIGVAVDAAVSRGLERLHRELRDGGGPLAQDLDAVAERLSASAVRGARRELDDMLGGCEGIDTRSCLQREVRALGAEASAGLVEGALKSHAWIAGALVFLSGVVAGTLARAAVRRLGGARREAARARA